MIALVVQARSMNSNFTIASHIVGMLAFMERQHESPVTSDRLAESVGTNPVVIRRVLSQLKQAGIVTSRGGAGGGSCLAREASKITLREVFEAVVDREELLLGRYPVGHDASACALTPVISGYVTELFDDARRALLASLEAITVEAMSAEIVTRCRDSLGEPQRHSSS